MLDCGHVAESIADEETGRPMYGHCKYCGRPNLIASWIKSKKKRTKRPTRQISVTGKTYQRLAEFAASRGITISAVTDAIVTRSLDDPDVVAIMSQGKIVADRGRRGRR